MIYLDKEKAKQDRKAAYQKYHQEVSILTEEIAHLVPGVEKREFRKWDLDHKIPISCGFENGIHPMKIACLSNLQVIPHIENYSKGNKLIYPLSILDQHDTIQAQLQEG